MAERKGIFGPIFDESLNFEKFRINSSQKKSDATIRQPSSIVKDKNKQHYS